MLRKMEEKGFPGSVRSTVFTAMQDAPEQAAALEETLDSGATAREMVRAVQPILKIRLARMQSDKVTGKFSQDLEELDALRKENERLKNRVEHWKGQLRRTTPETRSVRQGDIDRLARQLVRNYGGTLKASDISGRLKALGDLIVRGGDEFTWARAHERAPSALRGRSPFAFFHPSATSSAIMSRKPPTKPQVPAREWACGMSSSTVT